MAFSKHITIASLLTIALLLSLAEAVPPKYERQEALKFPYGNEKVQGVNLGGWLVLEPWITPSIFEEWAETEEVVDEYTFCAVLGSDEAYSRLSQHWNTWITQDDFNQIAAAGFNHVRIPIGYWAIDPLPEDPYVKGAYQMLALAVEWANAVGLMVMIDLHGAPGSQNGFDNSGRRGGISWNTGNTVAETQEALNVIRNEFAGDPSVASIEMINEPMGPTIGMGPIEQFYYDAGGALQSNPVATTFHDAFLGVTSWNDFGSGLSNLLLDTHHYEVFDSGSLGMSPSEHVSTACGFGAQMASTNKWTISGEWTGAQTDCAKWLNGLGVGARYDGTYDYNGESSYYIGSCDGKYEGTVAALSPQDKANIASFVEAQMDAFEEADGWIFWTWKTESAPEWNMQDLIANGLFPQPLSARQYPGQCG